MRRRLRLGMIGGGQGAFIGSVHRMAARLDDRYDLVAGALSSDPDRAKSSAADLLIAPDRAYPSVDALLSAESQRDDGIDVVAVVTPNHLHYSMVRKSLDHGLHVICDKPLTTQVADADDLVAAAARVGRVLAVTFNYSGYPLVRQAREMISNGQLGALRVVQVEYAQGWLAQDIETSGDKQAGWRTDPERAGVGGVTADIGSHAFHLAEFVTNGRVARLAADLSTHVPGRRLEDNVQMMLHFEGGARGALWASQVAVGRENSLRLRVFGERASIEWCQESPNQMRFACLGRSAVTITRGGYGVAPEAARASRIPAGHPEGYLEAFAQIYSDAADLIEGSDAARSPAGGTLVPQASDGARGVRFIHAAVESSRRNGIWIDL